MPRIGSVLVLAVFLFSGPKLHAQAFGPRVDFSCLTWLFGKPDPPGVPFTLGQREQLRVDAILAKWQRSGAAIQSFSCRFTCWDYDRTFGPKQHDFLICERHGVLKFRSPDSALFREDDIKLFNAAANKYVASRDHLEHLSCNGTSLYWWQPLAKTVQVIGLPNSWVGRATRDGPIPFLFPFDAGDLQKRFWLRESTPRDQVGKQIWLEAWPKSWADAGWIKRCEVILTLPSYRLLGLQFYLPNGSDRTAYLLEDFRVNKAASVSDADFEPTLPAGWRRVCLDVPPSSKPKEPALAASRTPPSASVSSGCPPISGRQNRSRAKRGRLLESRPVLPKFCRRGWVPCRNRCRGHCVRSFR